jgi:hypothetical protein
VKLKLNCGLIIALWLGASLCMGPILCSVPVSFSGSSRLEWLESHDRTHLVLLGHLSGFLFGDHTGRLRQC